MKKRCCRISRVTKSTISFVLMLCFLLSSFPQSVLADVDSINDEQELSSKQSFVSNDNGYIKYYVSKDTGGFYIMPSTHHFDETKEPSFGSFRINGEDYVFGGEYPDAEFVLQPIIIQGGTCQTVWRLNDLYVTQYLNIVKNEAKDNSYAVYIRYEVESAYDDAELDIEFEGRILLDTMFGPNDELPISISDDLTKITNETTISGIDMPTYFEVDAIFQVPARAYGLLIDEIDESVTSPRAITFARFGEAMDSIFDYNHNDEFSILGDSSVLLYFDGYTGSDSSLVYFSTIYGFDDLVTTSNEIAPVVFTQMAETPESPAVNSVTIVPEDKDYLKYHGAVQGDSIYLHVEVDAVGGADDTVTWRVDGNTSIATAVIWHMGGDFAYLDIALEEEATVLYVTATSEFDSSKYDTLEIEIIELSTDPYTITITSVGEGYSSQGFDTGISYYHGQFISIEFLKDYDTFDDGYQTKAIKGIIITDSFGNDVAYRGVGHTSGYELSFYMPASDIFIELVTGDARKIENLVMVSDLLTVFFSDRYNNSWYPGAPPEYSYSSDALFTAGNEIIVYANSLYVTDPGDLIIIGKNTSQAYGFSKLEPIDNGYWYYSAYIEDYYFVFSFIMPDEDVLFDFVKYTATVATVDEGYKFSGFWWDEESGDDEEYAQKNGRFYPGQYAYLDFTQDNETLDENMLPTIVIRNFIIKDSFGKDIEYQVSATSTEVWMSFIMPYSNATIELVSAPAHKIDTAEQLSDEFILKYAEKHNNPYHPLDNPWYYINDPFFAEGNVITIYMTSPYGMIPGDLSIVGKRTSQAYTLIELESLEDSQTGTPIYVYSFVMPDEDVIFGGIPRLDEEYKFHIIPDIPGNRGQLSFSGEDIIYEGDNARILPGKTVIVDISGIDYINHEFHGLSASNVRTGVAINVTEELEGQRYSFIMPAADVYVHLDVRQKPTYTVQADIDTAIAFLELKNERSGVSSRSELSGYAGDKITFGITNRDVSKILSNIQLLDAENQAVLQTFTIDDVYSDYYPGEFIMPARGVALRVEYIGAPPIPVTVGNSLPPGTVISPTSGQTILGQAVSFDFTTNDGRYVICRPVLRAYDSDENLLYEEYFQKEEDLTNTQIISFSSENAHKAGGVPAKIILDVYEQHFDYSKELVSIRPNSNSAENFSEIIVSGRNLYEDDIGVVYIGTSPNPTQPATISSYSFDMIIINIPEIMRPTDNDVTYYVKINDVEKSCIVTVERLLRRSPFGMLAVVSDNANRHSIIVADSDAELRQLAGSGNIILRMMGDVKYNLAADTYEFSNGDILINNFVTYSIAENNPLKVCQTNGDDLQRVYGVEITANNGKMSVPGLTFVNGEPIKINLQHGTRYIDTWAKNSEFNLVVMGTENIVIEYTSLDVGIAVISAGFQMELADAVLLKDSIAFGGVANIGIGLANGIEIEDLDWFSDWINVDVQRAVYAPNSVGGNFVFQGIETKGNAIAPTNLIPGFPIKAEVELYINTFTDVSKMTIDTSLIIKALANTEFDGSVGLVMTDNGGFVVDSFRIIVGGDWFQVPIAPPFATLRGIGGGVTGLATASKNINAMIPFRIDIYGILELIKLFEFNPIRMSAGAGEISFDAKAYIKVGSVKLDIINRFDGGIYTYENGIRFNVSLDAVFIKGFDVINGGGHVNLEYINNKFSFSGSLFVKIQVPKIHVLSVWIPPYFVITKWSILPWLIKGYWVAAHWEPVYIGPFTLLQLEANMSDTAVSAVFRVVGYGLRADYVYGGTPSIKSQSFDQSDSLETIEYLYDDDGEYAGYASYGSNLSVAAVPRVRGSNSMMSMSAENYEDWIEIKKIIIEGGTNPDDGQYYEGFEFEDWSRHFITFPDDIASHVDDYALMVTALKNDISITDSDGNPFILKYAADVGNGGVIEDDLNRAGVNAVVISNDSNGLEQEGLGDSAGGGDNGEASTSEAVTIMIRLPKEPGEWIVESSMPFASTIIRVAPLPEIGEATFDGTDAISWSAKNLDIGNDVYILEVRLAANDGSDMVNTDPGTLIDEIVLDSNVVDGFASGVYKIDLNQIADFESGEYYPRLVLLSVPRSEYMAAGSILTDGLSLIPRHSKNASTPLVHININEPAPVASINISPGGSGALRAEWQAADSKADGYILKVLGADGNPVYMETDAFDENGDVIGTNSSQIVFEIPNDSGENGSFSVLLGGLLPGVEYKVEITPYADVPTTINGEIFNNTIRGSSTLSNTTELPVPNIPVINAALPGSEYLSDGMGNRIIYVSSSFAFGLSSNQQCWFSVLQNGDVIYESTSYETNTSVTVSMAGLSASSIQIAAINQEGDTSYLNFVALVDETPPSLFVVTDEDFSIFSNQDREYVIMGYSEPGALITDDLGNTIRADEHGEFYLTGALPVAADDISRTITVSDSAGNFETADILIKDISSVAGDIDAISTIPYGTLVIDVEDRFYLKTIGELQDGTTITVPPNAVDYNILSGANCISISDLTGKVTALEEGIAFIEVSFTYEGDTIKSQALKLVVGTSSEQTVSISGRINAYDPKNETKITLYEVGTTNVIDSISISTLTTDSNPVNQSFTLNNILPGTYDLVIEKSGCLTYTITNIVVEDDDIDLTSDATKAYSTITLLAGDVDGDGQVSTPDLTLLLNSFGVAPTATHPHTDINGDGIVSTPDLTILLNNFGKKNEICTVPY